MTYRGRFAPSPTGPLHFGSLVAAVASFLDARAASGEWHVRIEDVDVTRTVPGASDQILRALDAFALHWDGDVMQQSQRTERYRESLEHLARGGLAYRCRCSRREIADSGLAGIDGPIYPGTCRNLELASSVEGSDRLRVTEGSITFIDRRMGTIVQDVAGEIGDFILRRRDGLFAYQLAVVVDDADQGITDVVRGNDLLLSTPRQILLQHCLSLPTPRYLHIPVATDAAGNKLSKQARAAPIDPARPGAALRQVLAFLGQPVPDEHDPAKLLAFANSRWSPARIPAGAVQPVTYGDGAG